MTGGLPGIAPGDSVLVVCAHPDDETLGAGGTISRLAAGGVTVHVLAVCCYPAAGPGTPSDPAARAAEFEEACTALGAARRRIAWTAGDRAREPGRHLRDLVTLIDSGPCVSVAATRPAALLIPDAPSTHQDHRAVHQAAMAAARPGGRAWAAPRVVLGYRGPDDAWLPGHGHRSVWADITAAWPAKEKALQAYGSQLRDDSHPRSIRHVRALDAAAGAAIGFALAERFTPYKITCP